MSRTDLKNFEGLLVIHAEESTDKLPHRDMAVVLISETLGRRLPSFLVSNVHDIGALGGYFSPLPLLKRESDQLPAFGRIELHRKLSG